MKTRITLAVIAAGLVSACAISPEQYETTPVVVSTAQGPVTCQLYTLDQITWDRAIHRPDAMSVATADTICRNEGARIIRDGSAGLVPEGDVLRETRPL